MRPSFRAAFLALILAQAAHSVEEYQGRLYDVFAPARAVSGLFGFDRRVGFIVFNASLVAFGLACAFGPVWRRRPAAVRLAWFWAALELANGSVHIVWALSAGAYRPGLWTAPVLCALAIALGVQIPKGTAPSP